MSDPFVGEIRLVSFDFAPRGWAFCHGQLMEISRHSALFSILGTTYGGNGQTTFALPNLRERVAIGAGDAYPRGRTGGSAEETLLVNQIPAHTHTLRASSAPLPADGASGAGLAAGAQGVDIAISPEAIGVAGSSHPHNNLPPYLALHYIIALEGILPTRD